MIKKTNAWRSIPIANIFKVLLAHIQTVTIELGELGSNVKKQFKSSDDEKKIKKKPKIEDVKPIQPVIPPEEK